MSGVLQPYKIVYTSALSYKKVVGTPDPSTPFEVGAGSAAGTYRVRIEIANMTAGSNGGFTIVKTVGGTQHYWGLPGGLSNGINDGIITLDTNTSTGTNASFAGYSGKFFIQNGSGSINNFEI